MTSSLRSRASTLCAHSRLPEVADSLIHSSWGRQAPRWDLRYAAISFIPFPGNAFGALIGGEFEGTWLYFCFFTIAGKPKKESPYGQIVTARPGGDYLGELGAARPAERPKFRPDFGLGDPAMSLVPVLSMYNILYKRHFTCFLDYSKSSATHSFCFFGNASRCRHAAGEKNVWMFGSRLRRSADPDPDPEGPEPSRAALFFFRAVSAAARRRAANAASTPTFHPG